VGRLGCQVVVLLSTIAFATGIATGNDVYKVDISPLPASEKEAFGEREAAMRKWGQSEASRITAWKGRQEAKLRAYKEMKAKEFAAIVRKMHCNKLKRNLMKKVALTTTEAKMLAKKRKEAAAKQVALERAREVLSKVAERDETHTRLLGGANIQAVNPKDAKFWLKAFETRDPEWQRARLRRMHHEQRVDPDWRRHQNNADDDGGISWSQRNTRMGTSYDQNPELQLTQPVETASFLQESTLVTPFDNAGASIEEDQAREMRREAELAAWLNEGHNKIEDLKTQQNGELKRWKASQDKLLTQLRTKKAHSDFCTRGGNKLKELVADAVINLPVPDEEKTAYEKPLQTDVKNWLLCERCKDPKPKLKNGQQPRPWP